MRGFDGILNFRWGPGQPDNRQVNENCLVVDIKIGSALLSSANCNSRYQYICEVFFYFHVKQSFEIKQLTRGEQNQVPKLSRKNAQVLTTLPQ